MFSSDRRHRIIFPAPRIPADKATRAASVTTADGKLIVRCTKCGRDNIFDQPYAYHAGFSEHGFAYSDSGHFTLVWRWDDPAMEHYAGIDAYPSVAHCFPAKDDPEQEQDSKMRRSFEDALPPAPDGSRWGFRNPARCIYCSEPISGSMFQTVYYLIFPQSIVTSNPDGVKLSDYLTKPSNTALEPTPTAP
jgi:uncharacterized C2H2 Zn-finger protein